jgi:phage terminase large subunit-like protein
MSPLEVLKKRAMNKLLATDKEAALVEVLLRQRARAKHVEKAPLDIVTWAESEFLVSEDDGSVHPIVLEPHQRAILRFVFPLGKPSPFSTVIYSTPKKGGKTTTAAVVGRYQAEQTKLGEIYTLANDEEQAKTRVFEAIEKSISLSREYDPRRRNLRGQWRILEREMKCLTSSSSIKALASEYRGSAGMNPTLTIFTELWGYTSDAAKRLWVETTPSPTRAVSMRWVETYAGFQGESELLEDLYNLGLAGHQLNANELGDWSAFGEAPNWDSLVPCWVNEAAGLFMYWDSGLMCRRMPWQRGEKGAQYYREQEATLTPNQFRRLHWNEWVGAESEFIPIEWWDANLDPFPLIPGEKTPLVIAVDASVTGDCTALTVVSRHSQHKDHICERLTRTWVPSDQPGAKMDYAATVTPIVDALVRDYHVMEIGYDPYQLHHWATEQRKKTPAAWYREFGQGEERLRADKGFYDLIRDGKLHHTGNPQLREHIQNCVAKIPKGEDNKLRLEKKAASRKIDGAVALSMACAECLRLNL